MLRRLVFPWLADVPSAAKDSRSSADSAYAGALSKIRALAAHPLYFCPRGRKIPGNVVTSLANSRYEDDMARKVILDVDPGIDDAMALCLALFESRTWTSWP